MRGRIVMDKVQVATARTRRSEVVGIGRARRARAKGSFVVDQHGAVALESMIVYIFLVSFLLVPLRGSRSITLNPSEINRIDFRPGRSLKPLTT